MSKFRLAIFASGNGSNAEVIINYFKNHEFVDVVLVLSNNPDAYVLERAKKLGVRSLVFNRVQFREGREVISWLHDSGVTHLVLAGFLWLIPPGLISEYPGRIVNIHPSLLPKFGGNGMYGMKVHEAVKLSGEKETGITIHVVNEHYDKGEVLFQARCSVSDADLPEAISKKVNELEYFHYPRVIEKWVMN